MRITLGRRKLAGAVAGVALATGVMAAWGPAASADIRFTATVLNITIYGAVDLGDLGSPTLANPDPANPDIDNPDLGNPAITVTYEIVVSCDTRRC